MLVISKVLFLAFLVSLRSISSLEVQLIYEELDRCRVLDRCTQCMATNSS